MGKHLRKRQRTETDIEREKQPLGTRSLLEDDAQKDDEERRLESLLFGVPYVERGDTATTSKNILVIDEGSDNDDAEGAKELEGMQNTDLFFIDDGTGGMMEEAEAEDEDFGESSSFQRSVHSESNSWAPSSELSAKKSLTIPETNNMPLKSHKTAWEDPADTPLSVSIAQTARTRKLRDAPSEDDLNGREYESRLRRQFIKMNPVPQWAKRRGAASKRRGSFSGSGEEDESDGNMSELLNSTSGILKSRDSLSRILPQGTVAIERLRDANQAAKTEGIVHVVRFHPSPLVPVLLVAGGDRRARLFNVNGHTNPLLQTLHVPSLPLNTAHFHPSGTSVLLAGPRPFFYTHDLQSGVTTRGGRNLWTQSTNRGSTKAAEQKTGGSMEICSFSPDGSLLAVAGRSGNVHIVDWAAGAAQVIGNLKITAALRDLWWIRDPNDLSARQLMTLGSNSEIHMWDVGQRRCVVRWTDEGAFGSSVMTGDNGGRYFATGSTSGYVNLYGPEAVQRRSILSEASPKPKPLKSIGNLTTAISSLRFNHDGQVLAIASKTKKDQMRMIHLPSMTAFGNWPTSKTPLGHVTSVDFSAGSEYIAMGNNRGRVLLYSLGGYALGGRGQI